MGETRRIAGPRARRAGVQYALVVLASLALVLCDTTLGFPSDPSSPAAKPVAVALASVEPGGCCNSFGARPGDEIWIVDTRSAACAVVAPGRMPAYRLELLDSAGHWTASDMKAFLAAQSVPRADIFWVHGNRVGAAKARVRGLELYRELITQVPAERPMRFIIWSWPADPIKGLLKDVRYKADLCDPGAYHFAWVLDRLPADSQVGVIGFSYGTRIVTGALHMLGGGEVARYALLERMHPQRQPVRVVSWAAAIDDDWLLPGRRHSLAFSQVEHLLLLNNSSDRALKNYHLIDRSIKPEALGYWGLPVSQLPPGDAAKVAQRDVCCLIGKQHGSPLYIDDPQVIAWTWQALQAPQPAIAKRVAKPPVKESLTSK